MLGLIARAITNDPPEAPRRRRIEEIAIIGALFLFFLLALLCFFKIICPEIKCPPGTYYCGHCPDKCCLPGGFCLICPEGAKPCPPGINCPSGCCIDSVCQVGFATPAGFFAPRNASLCLVGIDCPTGVCLADCCCWQCTANVTPCTTECCAADGKTCLGACQEGIRFCGIGLADCCDEFGRPIYGGRTCACEDALCDKNETCCSRVCLNNKCTCLAGGSNCTLGVQCCSGNCIIEEGKTTGACGFNCGAIDCTKCVGRSCGGTGQRSCDDDINCAGGFCDPTLGCVFCPAGSHWNPAKKCCVFDDKPDICIPKCPNGTEFDVAKNMCCVIGDPTKCCPVGSFWNFEKGMCCLIEDPSVCCPAGTVWNSTRRCCVDPATDACIYICLKDPKRKGCPTDKIDVDACDANACCPPNSVGWNEALNCCIDKFGKCMYPCTVDESRIGCPPEKKGIDACDQNACCPKGAWGWGNDAVTGEECCLDVNGRCITFCYEKGLISCPSGVGRCPMDGCCPSGAVGWDSDRKCCVDQNNNCMCSNDDECKICNTTTVPWMCGGRGIQCTSDADCATSVCSNGACCPPGSTWNTTNNCCWSITKNCCINVVGDCIEIPSLLSLTCIRIGGKCTLTEQCCQPTEDQIAAGARKVKCGLFGNGTFFVFPNPFFPNKVCGYCTLDYAACWAHEECCSGVCVGGMCCPAGAWICYIKIGYECIPGDPYAVCVEGAVCAEDPPGSKKYKCKAA